MLKMIQIRNVPEEVHRALKVRAARSGTTLSDMLLREVSSLARRPTLQDLMERLERRGPITVDERPVDAIRAVRDARP